MGSQRPLLDPGTTFAHYEVRSVIGRGGMGVVYLAHDAHLDRKVALKLLAPEFSTHENFRARFLRESRLAAAVDHPNIIPIYEAGDTDGQLFLAMRYVPGADLRTELDERGRLPLPEALDLLQQVADALDAAHAASLVHRDVKPANVLVAEPSRKGHRHAYLTDFGLTRRSSSISGLTTSGHFLGTLDYVAPEQIRGDPVDGRADVYSFACVAFAVLVGRPPFDGEDDVALMWAHLSRQAPRAAIAVPELAGDVDDALAAGLAKSREDRPDTCGALVALMEGRKPAATAPVSPAAAPPSPPPEPGPPRPDAPGPAVPSAAASPSSADRDAPEVAQVRAAPASREDPPGPRGADWRRRGPRRTPRSVSLLVAVLVAVVVAVVGLVLLPRGGEDYRTFASDDVPYTLEVPADWAVEPDDAGDSSVTVLSPTDLTGLFADDPEGMRTAATAVSSDPAASVGLAIYHRPRLGGDDPAALLLPARALLPGEDVDLRPGEPVSAGELAATAMDGRLGLGDDASLELRVLALDSTPRQLLVFFAPPSVFAERADTFDRVARSLETTG